MGITAHAKKVSVGVHEVVWIIDDEGCAVHVASDQPVVSGAGLAPDAAAGDAVPICRCVDVDDRVDGALDGGSLNTSAAETHSNVVAGNGETQRSFAIVATMLA